MHDELLRDEVDIVEFHEKYYLFRMKSEADSRRRPIFLVLFLENIVNLRQKVRNRRLVRIDDLFFRDIAFLEQKVHYPERFQAMTCFFLEITAFLRRIRHYQGMTSSRNLFFKDHLESMTKIGLEYTQFYDLVLA